MSLPRVVALLGSLALLAGPMRVRAQRVDYGVRIQPDTVEIGRPFRVVVHIRAPRDAKIAFPVGPDSGGSVEALDPRTIHADADSLTNDESAIYRLAAWDVGRTSLGLGDVVVVEHNLTRAIPLNALSVVVAPTVPRRGSWTPRPPRGLFPALAPWWRLWAIGAASVAAMIVLWLVVRWWRRRRRRAASPVGALSLAVSEFDALDRVGLLEAGEWGRYLALVAEIVRSFLARRIPDAPLSATTAELLAALHADPRVPIDRLRALLSETDSVKFAAQAMTTERARGAAQAARAFVIDVDAAVVAADAAVRDQAAREVSRAMEERRTARASGRGRAA
jgi:hypothetical protein